MSASVILSGLFVPAEAPAAAEEDIEACADLKGFVLAPDLNTLDVAGLTAVLKIFVLNTFVGTAGFGAADIEDAGGPFAG
ncbi:hypothetical protein FRB91_011938 [Serendipita sp. 411]|nr:hypothetical protein FRB91_011938 [Serendipita sp. 411]